MVSLDYFDRRPFRFGGKIGGVEAALKPSSPVLVRRINIETEEGTTMTSQHVRVGLAAVLLALAGPALAGPLDKAKDAVDPDCNVAKAARGAATKAVVGVRGNRCDVGETARDTLGIDDRDRKKDDDGPIEKLRKD